MTNEERAQRWLAAQMGVWISLSVMEASLAAEFAAVRREALAAAFEQVFLVAETDRSFDRLMVRLRALAEGEPE
jgi:hypothetical protein